jgi:hypothetical protein
MARVIHRPAFGWGFRAWCAEVGAWLWLAVLYLMAGATVHVLYAIIDFVAVEIVSGLR